MRAAFTALIIVVVAISLLAGCGQQEIVGADYAYRVLSQDDPSGAAVHDVKCEKMSDGNVRIRYTFRPDSYESPVAPESIVAAGDEVTIVSNGPSKLGRRDVAFDKGHLWVRKSFN